MSEAAPSKSQPGGPGTEEFPSGEVAMRAKKPKPKRRRFRHKRKVVK
jgi:hypothetical protein